MPLSESTVVTIKLGWLIFIVTLLMGLASSSGVLIYQVSELHRELRDLKSAQVAQMAEQQKNRESIIALTSTLQGKGVLK